MKKETGLMFKAPLVCAILSGQKTQTRRVLTPQPMTVTDGCTKHWEGTADALMRQLQSIGRKCPMGQSGDRIYVRETWNWFDPQSIPADRIGCRAPFTGIADGVREIPWAAAYAADGPLPYPGYDGKDHWQPSIHMPKWAARIWLEITGVRVERLQSITEQDAIAEGIERTEDFFGCQCWRDYSEPEGPDAAVCPDDPIGSFQTLWDSTTGRPALPANENSKRYARVKHWLDTHPDTTGWAANPWVWVIDFKTISTTGRPA